MIDRHWESPYRIDCIVTMGIGSSFATIPIIALIGTAAGLDVDGQHNHIWIHACRRSFIHYNIPLIIFGWLTVMLFG